VSVDDGRCPELVDSNSVGVAAVGVAAVGVAAVGVIIGSVEKRAGRV
jgi:hypothetical protein